MKLQTKPSVLAITLIALAACGAGVVHGQAPTLHWDNNGTTAGTNATTAGGNWGSVTGRWSTAADGTADPGVWVAGSIAQFHAGSVEAVTSFTGVSFAVTVNSEGGGPSFDIAGIVLDAGEGNLTFTGGGTLNLAADSPITAPATQSIGMGTVVLAGSSVNFNGAGTVLLTNGSNTYTGSTTISAGIVSVDGDANFGSPAATLILAGGRLNSTANRSVASAHPINVTANSSITTTSGAAEPTFQFSTSSYTVTPGAVLTFKNEGADGVSDTFKPRMSGETFTYTGAIVLDNGPLGLTELNIYNTFSNTNAISGAISGAGSLARSASNAFSGGVTVLTGANTYTGPTPVRAGTLLVNGSHTGGGAYTVSANPNPIANATLGGTGTIALAMGANMTVTGNLAPGATAGSTGTLTVNLASATEQFDLSPATLLDTGNLKFDLGAPAASDKVVLGTGTLNIGTLDFLDFTFTDIGGLTAGTYTLFDAPSTITGSIGSGTGMIGALDGALSINGTNDVILTVTGGGGFATADFNHSGGVNATDLEIWKTNFGTGTTNAQGDANGDGAVNGLDLLTWQRQLVGGSPVASVPEPASLALVGLGIGAVIALSRRRS